MWHLEKIVEVCKRTPQVRHWLPTREVGVVKQYLAAGNRFPPNLRVRVSTTKVGERRSRGALGLPITTVGVDDPDIHQCRAMTRGGRCGDCRACWTDVDVNMKAH